MSRQTQSTKIYPPLLLQLLTPHFPLPITLPQIDIPSQFDVLVVGAGAAGLYTALCLPEYLASRLDY